MADTVPSASGEQDGEPVRHFLRFKKRQYIIAGCLAALMVILIAGILYQTLKPVYNACTNKSANGILRQAAPNLFGNNQPALGAVAQKIKTLRDYQYDNNCDYVLAVYYTHAADFKHAQYYLDLYNKHGGIKQPLSNELGPVYPDPLLIQQKIKQRIFLW